MVDLSPPFRRAEQADAPVLARLIDIAGEGIPAYLWAQSATRGERPLDIGTRLSGREHGIFSYRNAIVFEVGGAVAGMVMGYRQSDPYSDTNLAHVPAVVRPVIELESLVPGSWLVKSLALLPDYRGDGLGSQLLGLARSLAEEEGARQLSLIVAADNEGACRLYQRSGYRAIAQRPVVDFPAAPHGGVWSLMVQDIRR